MNASVWEKVRKNLTLLQNEIDADELLPYLIEKDVVEIDIKKRLVCKPTNPEKVLCLFDVLKGSPPEKEAYRHLLEALRSSGFDYYSELADTIDATKTESDPSLQAKVDPSHYNDKVRHVLNGHFTNKRGQTTSLDKIKSVLFSQKVFKTTPWSDDELTKFVCSLFAGLEVDEKPGFLTGRKNVFFKHLANLGPKDESLPMQATPSNPGKDQHVNVSSLSPCELTQYLTKEIRKVEAKMSIAPLAVMEKEEISGNIFLGMNEHELEKVMPSSTFGLRCILKNIIERCQQKSVSGSRKSERFCPFGSKTKPSDCYIQGSFVDLKAQTRGKKLAPIRNCHQPEFASVTEIRDYIIIHCAIFAAACINQRQNGTIHFGIAPDDAHLKGRIVGLQLSPEEFEDRLLLLFFPKQHHLIRAAVSCARFIPVFKDDKYAALSPKRCVIEFDVVPGNSLGEEDQYVKVNAKDFPERYKNDVSQEPVYVLSDGQQPVMIPADDVRFDSRLPSSIICQRRQEEHGKSKQPETECFTRLHNHLTGGSNKMEDDVYKVVLLSSILPTSENLQNLDFIQRLQPEVVFDFDPRGYQEGIFKATVDQEQVLKILSVDDFDGKRKSKKDIDLLKKEMNESSYTHWMFCNGFKDKEKMEATHWNMKRRLAFRKAFHHYLEICHKDRLLIIMCLFSHSDIFIEACDEILLELPDQWILLTDEPTDGEKWQNIIKDRKRIFRDDLDKRCLIGLPWEQVNRGITMWCYKDDSIIECQIPHSRGVPVSVEKKKLNEWSDIEVVSSSDPSFPDDKTLREKQMEAEEKFYVGGQVQWLNFFSGHVCRRKINEELFKRVLDCLETCSVEYENKVLPVYLFHEPGAGGSTSAREILWSLRKIYRCCVLKRFTGQTFGQLSEFFKLKDDSPKPLLILIDNEDEDTLTQIMIGLDTYLKDSAICTPTFCVLLICFRTVFVPIGKRKLSMVKLKQFLDQEELAWFQKTYKDLKSRFDDPRSLISFNILKENFDRIYIQNTVKEFMKDVDNRCEEIILKFVSLINTFDLGFNAIPVSCFDVILKSEGSSSLRSKFSSVTKGGRKTCWEANVSQSFRVLLNLNDTKKQSRKTVRVFSQLTAEQILHLSKVKSGESEGDLVLSLLTEEIFENQAEGTKNLQDILANMIKHRALQEDGARKEKFSPLILSVWKKEGTDKVIQILTTLYRLNEDPYTAQQIARFHISCQKFEEAEFYAHEAVKKFAWNAALWNTYALVYKVQLSEKTKGMLPKRQYTESELKELIGLCMKSVELFRQEQSKNLNMTLGDETGYLGELDSVELIIKAIWRFRCFGSEDEAKKVTHHYLVSDDYTDERLEFLSTEERSFLKGLLTNSKEAMRVLDDNYLQFREDILVNPLSGLVLDSKKKLVDFKAFFNTFFGEKSERVPKSLSVEEKCRYRSRMVIWKGANSLSDILQVKRNPKLGEADLKKCYYWLLENIHGEYASLFDFERIIDIVTVMKLDNGPIPEGLKFHEMISWVKQLYEISWRENTTPRLEAFMYYALYNFPTEERLKCKSLASAPDLQVALKSWIEASQSSKKNRYRITHKTVTLFFLGNGPPLRDIVYSKKMGLVFDENSSHFAWDSPLLCKILRPMEGVLLPGGEYINFIDRRDGKDHDIKIKTSYKIVKDVLWRHEIYFYLGFSFAGLRAYGVTDENPLKNNVFLC